jgi:hypothetical protein
MNANERYDWLDEIPAICDYGGAKLQKIIGTTALYHDPVHGVYVVYAEGWILQCEETTLENALLYMDE